jgi:hypothetical protein
MSTPQASGENFASNPAQYVKRVNAHTGHEVGAIPADDFRRLVAEEIALDTFHARAARPNTPKPRQRAPRRSAAAAYELTHKNERRKGRRTSPTGLTVVK